MLLSDDIRHSQILVVDDEQANIRLLELILEREGYHDITITTDSREVLEIYHAIHPDLILTDLHMPHFTGYDVMAQLQPFRSSGTFLPVIVLTADTTMEAKRRALKNGATDLISKPFDNLEVVLRIKNMLRTRLLHKALVEQNQILDERVRERSDMVATTLEQLRQAQRRIVQQERLHALGAMATGIAHDFNNLLALILGHGVLLLEENGESGEDRLTRSLRAIVGAAQDGARMIKRLVQFQRPSSEVEFHETLPLSDLVNESIALTRPRWKEQALAKGINISIETDLQKLPDIAGDPSEIRELLTNAIFNAIDAMPQGGTISFRTAVENDSVLFEIADTGMGMNEETRQKCLEPFFTTKGERGTGLGLSMIYGIVQRHRGTLDIESQPGLGTKLQIRLPKQLACKVEAAPVLETALSPLDVLVVDDQPVLCQILVEYLEKDSHRVVTAQDADEAMSKFRERHFDLVITDKAMPGKSGDELAVALRAIRQDIMVILLTGFAETGISESPSPAVDAVLGKPLGLPTLRHAVAKVVADRTLLRSRARDERATPAAGFIRTRPLPAESGGLGDVLPTRG